MFERWRRRGKVSPDKMLDPSVQVIEDRDIEDLSKRRLIQAGALAGGVLAAEVVLGTNSNVAKAAEMDESEAQSTFEIFKQRGLAEFFELYRILAEYQASYGCCHMPKMRDMLDKVAAGGQVLEVRARLSGWSTEHNGLALQEAAGQVIEELGTKVVGAEAAPYQELLTVIAKEYPGLALLLPTESLVIRPGNDINSCSTQINLVPIPDAGYPERVKPEDIKGLLHELSHSFDLPSLNDLSSPFLKRFKPYITAAEYAKYLNVYHEGISSLLKIAEEAGDPAGVSVLLTCKNGEPLFDPAGLRPKDNDPKAAKPKAILVNIASSLNSKVKGMFSDGGVTEETLMQEVVDINKAMNTEFDPNDYLVWFNVMAAKYYSYLKEQRLRLGVQSPRYMELLNGLFEDPLIKYFVAQAHFELEHLLVGPHPRTLGLEEETPDTNRYPILETRATMLKLDHARLSLLSKGGYVEPGVNFMDCLRGKDKDRSNEEQLLSQELLKVPGVRYIGAKEWIGVTKETCEGHLFELPPLDGLFDTPVLLVYKDRPGNKFEDVALAFVPAESNLDSGNMDVKIGNPRGFPEPEFLRVGDSTYEIHIFNEARSARKELRQIKDITRRDNDYLNPVQLQSEVILPTGEVGIQPRNYFSWSDDLNLYPLPTQPIPAVYNASPGVFRNMTSWHQVGPINIVNIEGIKSPLTIFSMPLESGFDRVMEVDQSKSKVLVYYYPSLGSDEIRLLVQIPEYIDMAFLRKEPRDVFIKIDLTRYGDGSPSGHFVNLIYSKKGFKTEEEYNRFTGNFVQEHFPLVCEVDTSVGE